MALTQMNPPAARRSTFEGLDAVTLAAGDLEAVFVPGAGMTGVSLLHRGDELIDRRGGLREYRDSGAVMGIPLLHPWANRLSSEDYELDGRRAHVGAWAPRDENGLPIHGLLGARAAWAVDALVADAHGARLRASLDFAGPELLAAFPFPHSLAMDVSLTAERLTISTTVAASGDVPVPVAFGFHPYLRLPGVDRSRWRLSFPARRCLDLDARGIPTGHGHDEPQARFALGAAAFDDAFDAIAAGAAWRVSGGGRSLSVIHDAGFPVAQVYSPPGAQFICLEPMTAPVDALRTGGGLRRAQPGSPVTAAFSIAVS